MVPSKVSSPLSSPSATHARRSIGCSETGDARKVEKLSVSVRKRQEVQEVLWSMTSRSVDAEWTSEPFSRSRGLGGYASAARSRAGCKPPPPRRGGRGGPSARRKAITLGSARRSSSASPRTETCGFRRSRPMRARACSRERTASGWVHRSRSMPCARSCGRCLHRRTAHAGRLVRLAPGRDAAAFPGVRSGGARGGLRRVARCPCGRGPPGQGGPSWRRRRRAGAGRFRAGAGRAGSLAGPA